MTCGVKGSAKRYVAHRGDGLTPEQGLRLTAFVQAEANRRATLLAQAKQGNADAIRQLEIEYHCTVITQEVTHAHPRV